MHRNNLNTNAENHEKQVILTAAVSAFAQYGYSGTSMRSIAQKLNRSVSQIYYYFPSKQAILREIVIPAMNEILNGIGKIVNEDEDSVAKLHKMVKLLVTFHIRNKDRAFVADSEIRSMDQSLLQEHVRMRDEVELQMRLVIKDGIEDHIFKVDDIAVTVRSIAAICVAVAYWYKDGGQLKLDDVVKLQQTMIMRMVGVLE